MEVEEILDDVNYMDSNGTNLEDLEPDKLEKKKTHFKMSIRNQPLLSVIKENPLTHQQIWKVKISQRFYLEER